MKSVVHLGDHRPVVVDAVAVHFPDDQAAQSVFVDISQLCLQRSGAFIGDKIEIFGRGRIVVPQPGGVLFFVITRMPLFSQQTSLSSLSDE